jgi:aryl-alcohol dehydrogenase-like predicted oxidoreductase
MKHISIGGLDVSRIGLGAMSMAGYYNIGAGSDAESIRTIHRALDLGVTHLDTAEIYGPYTNEELVGRAIKNRRDKVMLATKFGIVSHSGGGPGVLDSSPANIRVAVEGSLKRLAERLAFRSEAHVVMLAIIPIGTRLLAGLSVDLDP